MKKKNLVFDEFIFDYFQNFSTQNLFYKNTFGESSKKVMLILLIGMIISLAFNISWWYFESKSITGMIPFMVCTISILFYLSVVLKIKSRKELKANQNPLPKKFWNWDSKELTAEKIRMVSESYRYLSNKVISSFVTIAEKRLSKPVENPFKGFQKFAHYTLKLLLGVVISLIVFELQNSYSLELLKSSMVLVLKSISLYAMIIGTWHYLFLKQYLERPNSEKKRLTEFVFVMSNIVSIREQKNKKPKKKSKKK